jgi:hypothetical protein
MVCDCNVPGVCPQPEITLSCPAKVMEPRQRQDLALQALAGTDTISGLAAHHEVSRKFVYQQAAKGEEALQEAFSPEEPGEERILFHLPVTKAWLRQMVLGLTLICHSSIRGVGELFRDVFDYPISVGTVHAILLDTVAQARSYNHRQDLSGVRIGAHDEIFQSGRPVLVGADADSTYCYLLSLEDHRDADTWGIRLLELQDQAFHPDATIADAGSGLRAGQALAMPGLVCRGDVFHALQTVQSLVTFLENRAYGAIGTHADLEMRFLARAALTSPVGTSPGRPLTGISSEPPGPGRRQTGLCPICTGLAHVVALADASDSPHPRSDRWVHYFANQHPGEHNSQWRMVGMVHWLLSDEGADCRCRSLPRMRMFSVIEGMSSLPACCQRWSRMS